MQESGVRRPRRRGGLLLVFLLVVVLTAGYTFLRSPYFAVTELEVTGLRTLSAGDVLRWSGIQAPVQIWDIDPGAAARRLQAHPALVGARVSRHWPNRVRVAVLERTPVAVIAYRGLWLLADAEGVAFRLRQTRPPGLPELRGVPVHDQELGRTLPGRLAAAARCAAYLRQYDLAWVQAVEVTGTGLRLHLRGGVPAYFGRVTEAPDRKLAALKTLWREWSARLAHVRAFDVRDPDLPAVRTDSR